jgi:rare lipoprotein A
MSMEIRALHKHSRDRNRRTSWIVSAWAGVMALLAGGSAWSAADPQGPADSQEAVAQESEVGEQVGLISWYGHHFHLSPTASGELFDANDLTMAHPSLPFGTQVRVTNLRNGRSVVLRVNDRGPFVQRRIADVSHAAAQLLGMVRSGVVRARLEILGAVSSSD